MAVRWYFRHDHNSSFHTITNDTVALSSLVPPFLPTSDSFPPPAFDSSQYVTTLMASLVVYCEWPKPWGENEAVLWQWTTHQKPPHQKQPCKHKEEVCWESPIVYIFAWPCFVQRILSSLLFSNYDFVAFCFALLFRYYSIISVLAILQQCWLTSWQWENVRVTVSNPVACVADHFISVLLNTKQEHH